MNDSDLMHWLVERISTTRMEANEAKDLNVKIGKGGMLCAYQEIANYIRTHRQHRKAPWPLNEDYIVLTKACYLAKDGSIKHADRMTVGGKSVWIAPKDDIKQ